jgi:phytoene dehydrogenase-like protein
MEHFDAAIVGAGPEGLTAATMLARAGLRIIVFDRAAEAGGRALTREFHPGFRASAFADELAFFPVRLFRALDLARHGAILVPAPASVCVGGKAASILFANDERAALALPPHARDGVLGLRREIDGILRMVEARAGVVAPRPRRRWLAFGARKARPAPWPGADWLRASLDEVLRSRVPDDDLRLHLAAEAMSGRAVSPFLAGTAMHLLAPGTGRSGMPVGGLGALGAALARAAEAAGAVLRLGADVAEYMPRRGFWGRIVLASGEEIRARAILSTLDVKRSLLSLPRSRRLSADATKRIAQFRIAGQSARVLFALDAAPAFAFARDAPDAARGPIHVMPGLAALSAAHNDWQAGRLTATPLVTLRVPSLTDPRLAPRGKAVLTATLSPIPGRLVDGGWDKEKRMRLAALALVAAERVSPGITRRVIGIDSIVAPDVEDALGLTGGDLDGGELAADQALGLRPLADCENGRTPLAGLYLGGPSAGPAPFLLGASGAAAADAILADLKGRRR